jgi:hypothetical protein
MPISRNDLEPEEEPEAMQPEAHEVSTVAGFMSDLALLAKSDPEAFKKRLYAHWDKMKATTQP